MDIQGVIKLLREKPFVLESLAGKTQISFLAGNKITLSDLNDKRQNFVHKTPEFQNSTANFILYGHDDKSIIIHLTDDFANDKRIYRVLFSIKNGEKYEENLYTIKCLIDG